MHVGGRGDVVLGGLQGSVSCIAVQALAAMHPLRWEDVGPFLLWCRQEAPRKGVRYMETALGSYQGSLFVSSLFALLL